MCSNVSADALPIAPPFSSQELLVGATAAYKRGELPGAPKISNLAYPCKSEASAPAEGSECLSLLASSMRRQEGAQRPYRPLHPPTSVPQRARESPVGCRTVLQEPEVPRGQSELDLQLVLRLTQRHNIRLLRRVSRDGVCGAVPDLEGGRGCFRMVGDLIRYLWGATPLVCASALTLLA